MHPRAHKADAFAQAANYVLAPLILVVFVIVVSFVLLNMVRRLACNNGLSLSLSLIF